jgi:hypothetical protein
VVELNGVLYTGVDELDDGMVGLTQVGGERPPDDRFEYLEKWNAWQAEVPLGECQAAYFVKSMASYLGYECQVISIADDKTALVYYLGGNTGQAEADGFVQSDPGTFSKVVPISDLHGYREEWQDLLFDRWREDSFKRSDGEALRT